MNIYTKAPQYVLGFHGTDQDTVDNVLKQLDKNLKPSEQKYDWLGKGIYFWLNDPVRALEWAKHKKKEKPAVIGAIIDLGTCLNFAERECIEAVRSGYNLLKEVVDITEYKNDKPDAGGFNLRRPLDCAVINYTCENLEKNGMLVDTVMGYFQEDEEAFPGAGIRKKSHTQICVRNSFKILGYFLPKMD